MDTIPSLKRTAWVRYNMAVRYVSWLTVIFCIVVAGFCVAQEPAPVERVPVDKNAPAPKDNRTNPPRSDQAGPEESSSKETEIDIAPPTGDAKDHPGAEEESEYTEFHPWDPHKASKDIEVGDFYAKRENYNAAISRYREALVYKPRDAEATFKLASTLEKVGDTAEALTNYREYLKILPKGPYAEQAQKGIDRLKDKAPATSSQVTPNPPSTR